MSLLFVAGTFSIYSQLISSIHCVVINYSNRTIWNFSWSYSFILAETLCPLCDSSTTHSYLIHFTVSFMGSTIVDSASCDNSVLQILKRTQCTESEDWELTFLCLGCCGRKKVMNVCASVFKGFTLKST